MNKFLGILLVTFSFAAHSEAVRDELFVRWKTDLSSAQRAIFHETIPAHSIWTSTLVRGLERVKLADGVVIERAQAAYAANPQVLYVEPVQTVERHLDPMPAMSLPTSEPSVFEALASPNDPMYAQQWALNGQYGVMPLDAWKSTRGSRAVKVAIIDTGISLTHPDLQGKVGPGYDFIDRTDKITDGHGHGTHVSGIIGANTDNGIGIAGINPEVTLIPVRAVPNEGDETDAHVIEAFEFAANAGARVANGSFGKDTGSQAVADAIAAAGDKGLLAVIAAGNDGQDINVHKTYPASFHTANMVVVAATTARGTLAFFSNYGLNAVDVAAPGSGILSSVSQNDGYASWSGTSMAAPQVAGVAALALSANPSLTTAQLKQIVISSVDMLPSLSGKVTSGGTVNAAKAVQAALALPH